MKFCGKEIVLEKRTGTGFAALLEITVTDVFGSGEIGIVNVLNSVLPMRVSF